jgi:23S rRNA pseudouridine2605 synthase
VEAGRVTLDGNVLAVSERVAPDADVRIDGKPMPDEPPKVYFLLYKPRGVITTRSDPEGRKRVLDLVSHLPYRIEPVGRLDVDTEGAILLTNDGALAHRLTHPSMKVPKRYRVKVYRCPTPDKLRAIEQGRVFLDDGPIAPARVRILESTESENTWVEMTVTEGRNRLVRRIFQQLRHPVSKLRRESFATISIRGMERGEVRMLTGPEVERLRLIASGVRPERAGKAQKKKKGFAKAKPKLGRPQARRRRMASKRRRNSGRSQKDS